MASRAVVEYAERVGMHTTFVDASVAEMTVTCSNISEAALGNARLFYTERGNIRRARVVLGSHRCFLLDNSICRVTQSPAAYAATILCASAFSFLLAVSCMRNRLVVPSASFLALTTLAYAWLVSTCARCDSLSNTLLHELGHAFGLMHTNASNTTCGCSPTRECATQSVSIMQPKASRASCLSPNDLEGLDHLYGRCGVEGSGVCLEDDRVASMCDAAAIAAVAVLVGGIAKAGALRLRRALAPAKDAGALPGSGHAARLAGGGGEPGPPRPIEASPC